ncbi:MAG: hypothetical protein KAT70_03720 [Thermoplasmata archaeon]|nr:hypothetical protein [Thermoplasmata archaeon]
MEDKAVRGVVRCPICGTLVEVDLREPKAICTFCGGVIVLGEKSGL